MDEVGVAVDEAWREQSTLAIALLMRPQPAFEPQHRPDGGDAALVDCDEGKRRHGAAIIVAGDDAHVAQEQVDRVRHGGQAP
jgi:hypothetical protein